jgi:hypothetical protein
MIRKRPAADRGHANHGWLDTWHSFSFARYYDPEWMGFATLRVINDDQIAPGTGFGTHGHDNMEIVTWVVSGALEHRDSTGGGSVLRPGDVQRMTAGSGVTHSEFNHSPDEPLRLLQIWIIPAEKGLEPEYVEKHFPEESRHNQLRLIVSPGGEDGSVDIHQDARIYASLLDPGTTIEHPLEPGRRAWLQMIEGNLRANGEELVRGDGLAVDGDPHLTLEATEPSQFLLFDLG